MKVVYAAIIGANPALTLAAVMPIPNTKSEYNFAGLLQNKSIELVKCKTINQNLQALKIPNFSFPQVTDLEVLEL